MTTREAKPRDAKPDDAKPHDEKRRDAKPRGVTAGCAREDGSSRRAFIRQAVGAVALGSLGGAAVDTALVDAAAPDLRGSDTVTGGSSLAGARTPATATSVAAAAAPDDALDLGSLPLLFADDSGIATRQGIVRTPHAARTLPEPVVRADRPWEGDRVYIYGAVQAEADGSLRMWYMSRPVPETGGTSLTRAGGVEGLRAGGFDEVLYATSRDGIHWDKPSLGLFTFNGSRANNIVFDLHSPSVIRDERERDPAKRYKMVGALQGHYWSAYSADGLRWTSAPRNPIFDASDTITLAQHPRTGEYLAYHKRPATVRGFPRRVVWLSRSRDFDTWSEPELVFAPDERDDAWVTRPEVERTEVYNMAVYPHAAGFIGLPTIFRVMTVRTKDQITPGQSPVDGPIDVELATSVDGRAWSRSARREVIIPRGAPGTFDGGAILGVSSGAPVAFKDETFVYYTALTTGHGAPIPPKRISVGRAAWRRDGFVSLDAGPDGGRLETRPLRLRGPDLIVNADASRGRVRVALLEADGDARTSAAGGGAAGGDAAGGAGARADAATATAGATAPTATDASAGAATATAGASAQAGATPPARARAIPGFSLDDCVPLTTDATQAPVRWRTSARPPLDRPVRILVELTSARLYSLAAK